MALLTIILQEPNQKALYSPVDLPVKELKAAAPTSLMPFTTQKANEEVQCTTLDIPIRESKMAEKTDQEVQHTSVDIPIRELELATPSSPQQPVLPATPIELSIRPVRQTSVDGQPTESVYFKVRTYLLVDALSGTDEDDIEIEEGKEEYRYTFLQQRHKNASICFPVLDDAANSDQRDEDGHHSHQVHHQNSPNIHQAAPRSQKDDLHPPPHLPLSPNNRLELIILRLLGRVPLPQPRMVRNLPPPRLPTPRGLDLPLYPRHLPRTPHRSIPNPLRPARRLPEPEGPRRHPRRHGPPQPHRADAHHHPLADEPRVAAHARRIRPPCRSGALAEGGGVAVFSGRGLGGAAAAAAHGDGAVC